MSTFAFGLENNRRAVLSEAAEKSILFKYWMQEHVSQNRQLS
jgi:hypothetical protein